MVEIRSHKDENVCQEMLINDERVGLKSILS